MKPPGRIRVSFYGGPRDGDERELDADAPDGAGYLVPAGDERQSIAEKAGRPARKVYDRYVADSTQPSPTTLRLRFAGQVCR